jgi:hypothetical protein
MRYVSALVPPARLSASFLLAAVLVGGVRAQAPISLLPAGEPGTPLQVDGRILGPGGPIANAALYVYQTDATGIYSNAEHDDNTKPRLKARFATDAQGRFACDDPPSQCRDQGRRRTSVEVTPRAGRCTSTGGVRGRLAHDRRHQGGRAGKFYFLCTPKTAAGGSKKCTDVTFRLR